jgi:esterase
MELFGSVDTFLAARRQVAPSTPDSELDRVARAAVSIQPAFLQAASEMWNIGHPDGALSSRFTGPVLILPGADDPLATPEVVASAVANRFDSANSTATEIDRSSHWPHVEQPSAVAKALSRFLAHDLATEASLAHKTRAGK